jgi:hypothetical protein
LKHVLFFFLKKKHLSLFHFTEIVKLQSSKKKKKQNNASLNPTYENPLEKGFRTHTHMLHPLTQLICKIKVKNDICSMEVLTNISAHSYLKQYFETYSLLVGADAEF